MLSNLIRSNIVDTRKLLLKYYKKLDLDEKQLILLFHLADYYVTNQLNLSIQTISKHINISVDEISNSLNVLLNRGYVSINLEYTKNLKAKEVINIDDLLKAIEKLILEEIKEEKISENEDLVTKIINLVESSFNKPLTPSEIDIALNWVEKGETIERIKKAIDICVKKKVSTLKYADRVLLSLDEAETVIVDEEKSKMLAEIYRNIK